MKLNFENRNRLTQAVAFTAHIHGTKEETRMLSMLGHCMETAEIVARLTKDEDTRVAALLHDIPEYFPGMMPVLQQRFGSDVAALCQLERTPGYMTDSGGDNWQRRKLYVINRLAGDDERRKRIFLADKLSEVRYLSLNGLEAPNARKNPSMLIWYYRSVLLALGGLKYTEPYREMETRLKELIGNA